MLRYIHTRAMCILFCTNIIYWAVSFTRIQITKRNDQGMKSFHKYSVLECEQIEKIRKIGELYGNSPELKNACKEAYQLYRSGKISADCYGKIYSDAFDNYFKINISF